MLWAIFLSQNRRKGWNHCALASTSDGSTGTLQGVSFKNVCDCSGSFFSRKLSNFYAKTFAWTARTQKLQVWLRFYRYNGTLTAERASSNMKSNSCVPKTSYSRCSATQLTSRILLPHRKRGLRNEKTCRTGQIFTSPRNNSSWKLMSTLTLR